MVNNAEELKKLIDDYAEMVEKAGKCSWWMVIKHIANLIKHRHNLWGTQLFSEGWQEGYGMGKMEGQKMAYARLLKVIHNLDPIAYQIDVEKQMILDKIVKEMWGFYDERQDNYTIF